MVYNILMIKKHLERMIEIFGELPDPIHQPVKFRHLVLMYQMILEREQHRGANH